MNNDTIENIDEQIISLRKQNITQREIARCLNVTRDKVRYVCKKHGLKGMRYEKECRNCSDIFMSQRNHSKYCSEKCRNEYNRTVTDYGDVTRNCRYCSKEFAAYSTDNQVYCSDECRDEQFGINRKDRLAQRTIRVYRYRCKGCKKTKRSLRKGLKYCSSDCNYEHYYRTVEAPRRKARRVKKQLTCNECGKTFSNYRKLKYCSKQCSKRKSNRENEVRRRHKLRENGKIDWDISIDKLMSKYDGQCYICNEQCNLNDYEVRDDGTFIAGESYPSVDHVVAVANGGTHTWDNVELAHRSCNAIKGIDDIEIRLF